MSHLVNVVMRSYFIETFPQKQVKVILHSMFCINNLQIISYANSTTKISNTMEII